MLGKLALLVSLKTQKKNYFVSKIYIKIFRI